MCFFRKIKMLRVETVTVVGDIPIHLKMLRQSSSILSEYFFIVKCIVTRSVYKTSIERAYIKSYHTARFGEKLYVLHHDWFCFDFTLLYLNYDSFQRPMQSITYSTMSHGQRENQKRLRKITYWSIGVAIVTIFLLHWYCSSVVAWVVYRIQQHVSSSYRNSLRYFLEKNYFLEKCIFQYI